MSKVSGLAMDEAEKRFCKFRRGHIKQNPDATELDIVEAYHHDLGLEEHEFSGEIVDFYDSI